MFLVLREACDRVSAQASSFLDLRGCLKNCHSSTVTLEHQCPRIFPLLNRDSVEHQCPRIFPGQQFILSHELAIHYFQPFRYFCIFNVFFFWFSAVSCVLISVCNLYGTRVFAWAAILSYATMGVPTSKGLLNGITCTLIAAICHPSLRARLGCLNGPIIARANSPDWWRPIHCRM